MWRGQLGPSLLRCLSLDFRSVTGGWGTATRLMSLLQLSTAHMPDADTCNLHLAHHVLGLLASLATCAPRAGHASELEALAFEAHLQNIFSAFVLMTRERPVLAASALGDGILLRLVGNEDEMVREESLAFVLDVLRQHVAVGIAHVIEQPAAEDICTEMASIVLRWRDETAPLAASALKLLLQARPALAQCLFEVPGLVEALQLRQSTDEMRDLTTVIRACHDKYVVSKAATCIQAVWRGHATRKQMAALVRYFPNLHG